MTAPSRRLRLRLALLALRLYPLAFRRRYGQEMRALVEETPTRAGTVFDLLCRALLAHLRPPAAAAGAVEPAERVRASTSGVLACWVAFAAAGFGFYKTTEDGSFTAAGYAHPLLGDVHFSVQALGLVGSAAVLLGALPLTLAAVAAARRERSLRRLVRLPVLAVLVFAGLSAGLVAVAHVQHPNGPTTGGGIALIAWGVAGLACGAVCVLVSRRALFAVRTSPRRLVAAFASGALVTAAMVAITVAVALYAIALPVDAAHLAGGANGPLQAMSVSVSLVLEVVVMAVAAALAATATGRGWRAAGELHAERHGANL
jgi:hypothetical protein